MVHLCVVCSRNSRNNTNLSFHLVPKNETRRNLWINALQLKSISDWHRVCSNHFSKDSFICKNKRKIIKKDAIPLSIANVTSPLTMPSKLNEFIVEVSPSSVCITSSTLKRIEEDDFSDNENIVDVSPSLAFCITSTAKRILGNNDLQVQSKNIKKYFNYSRIGDLDQNDFSTPNKRRRNLLLVKNTVQNLRRNNKILHQRNQRLLKKIDLLNEKINQLQQMSNS